MKTLDEVLDLWKKDGGDLGIAERYRSIIEEAAQSSDIFQEFLEVQIRHHHSAFYKWAGYQIIHGTSLSGVALDGLGACLLVGACGITIGIEMEKP
jgi:hypothetical protein